MMTYNPFDIVEVPFPFSDLPKSKKRKALVLSTWEFNKSNSSTILMMITSAAHSEWYNDVPIKSWAKSGLKKPCVARMKIFTLDNRLIIGRSGILSKTDRKNIENSLRGTLGVLS